MLDVDGGEATSEEFDADGDGVDTLEAKELPRVTEPADDESTKPDGIKLRDAERSEAGEVVLNKPPVVEAEHADT